MSDERPPSWHAGDQPPALQPGFAGIATFLRADDVPVAAVAPGTVAVSGIPLDGFGDTPGTSDGPRGIREASIAFLASLLPTLRGTLVDVDSERRLELVSDLPLVDVGDVDPLAGAGSLWDHLSGHASAVATRTGLAVFLGGTRAITAPLLDGVARATGRRMALLRLGATLDLGDEPPDRPLAPGAALLAASRVATRTACLGVYGLLPAAEWRRAAGERIAVTPLTDWRRQGLARTARDTVEALLRDADDLYVSIDVRVADAAFAAGRGRTVSGGLLPYELLEVAEALAPFPLAAIDLVEVAPPVDSTRRAEHLAFQTLLALLMPRLAGSKAVTRE
jgi:formiminoglutamase